MYKDTYVILRTPEGSGNLSATGVEATIEVEEAELSPAQAEELNRDERIQCIAPRMPWRLIEPMAAIDDSSGIVNEVTWGVEAVRASESPFDGSGISVAILDTGIDKDHPAFTGIDIVTKNFTSEANGDINGHGTHCAGTIFGRDVNGARIGVARNINKAIIGKVIGEGSSSTGIAQAMNWAKENGAHVISMSLGIDFPKYVNTLVTVHDFDIRHATSKALVDYQKNVELFNSSYKFIMDQAAFGDGIIIVAAAGNESKRPTYEIAASPPAIAKGIISVAALYKSNEGLKVASFSNTGAKIAAPGVGVLSAKGGGGLVALSGTSMATPHVAGVAALWAQKILEEGFGLDSEVLKGKVLDGTMAPLAPGESPFNVGRGLVQAPLS